MRSNKPTKAEQQRAEKRAKNRVLAAAFLNVRVVDLLPHLRNVTSNSSIARARYVAACPVCGEQTFSLSQGAGGVAWGRACQCSDVDIANAIVFYNSAILSRLLTKCEASGNEKALALIKATSPVAWRRSWMACSTSSRFRP